MVVKLGLAMTTISIAATQSDTANSHIKTWHANRFSGSTPRTIPLPVANRLCTQEAAMNKAAAEVDTLVHLNTSSCATTQRLK